MVSLQAALSQKERSAFPATRAGDTSSSKKRRWEDGEEGDHLKPGLSKELKLWKDDDNSKLVIQPTPAAASDIDLHLEMPLPPEWQRCLDIQSGKIHFYNTRTHKKTSRDPRESADEVPPSTGARPVCLDLELNLMCEPSPGSLHGGGGGEEVDKTEKGRANAGGVPAFSCDIKGRPGAGILCKTPSWVSLDADPGEMVATVCGRCHMLVMMCKSSPSCPNCKFLHPLDQMPPSALLKPGAAQALVL